jgi:hypothetical protein
MFLDDASHTDDWYFQLYPQLSLSPTAAFKISFAGIPFHYEIRCSYVTLSSTSSCVGKLLEFRSFVDPKIGQNP